MLHSGQLFSWLAIERGLLLLAWLAICDCACAEPTTVAPSSGSALWEIVFEDGLTTEEYAKQLDYFKIEIGAVSKNGKIEYVSQVTKPKPVKRQGRKETDYRLHIGWKKGTLHAADRKLLAKAGISSEGKELMHYFPIELQAKLAALESAYGKGQQSTILRTRFLLRPQANNPGYEFVVVAQDPPPPAAEPASSSPVEQ